MSSIFLKILQEQHDYHLTDRSPWPFFVSVSVFNLVISIVFYFKFANAGFLIFAFIQLLYFLFKWFGDVAIEGTFEGAHTKTVQKNIYTAFMLFLSTEVMFFFGLFWAFFYYSGEPTFWLGEEWPPVGIEIINPFALPFFNTLLLFLSSITVTLAHSLLVLETREIRSSFLYLLALTIIYGALFVLCQWFEYHYAQFSIASSVYGSIFYLITGFHGLHVIIGLVFLCVCWVRFYKYQPTYEHFAGFECAAWYWHFVDYVWFYVYTFLYLGSVSVPTA